MRAIQPETDRERASEGSRDRERWMAWRCRERGNRWTWCTSCPMCWGRAWTARRSPFSSLCVSMESTRKPWPPSSRSFGGRQPRTRRSNHEEDRTCTWQMM